MLVRSLRPLLFNIRSVLTPRTILSSSDCITAKRPTTFTRMVSASAKASNESKPRQKTFENQSKLPRLPVPNLEDSLEGYLKSLLPFLEQQYGSSLPNELEKRKLYIKDFLSKDGLGRKLQQRLMDLDSVSPNNWLDDTLWLSLAYMTWRDPLLVNSDWWMTYQEDPGNPEPPVAPGATNKTTIPLVSAPSHSYPAGSQGGGAKWIAEHPQEDWYQKGDYDQLLQMDWITPWQVRRASWLSRRFADFRTSILKEEVAPHMSRTGPMDMAQFQRIFNFGRIPMPHEDKFSVIDNKAKHITLMVDDFIYSVDIFSDGGADGIPEPIPVAEIERRFTAAVNDAKKRKDAGEQPAQIGILAADHRDVWTFNRETVLHASPKNRGTFDAINSSLIVVSLDPYTLPTLPTNDPLRMGPVDAQLRNASTGTRGGRNRWFDKPVSVVMETNGRASTMGEHAPVDALLPSMIIDFCLQKPVDNSQFPAQVAPTSEGWKREDWEINEDIQEEIKQCTERNKKIIADSDVSALWWGEYGGDWIKKNAKLSPDGYMQQALQLAWWRDQGTCTATYETASTRAFLHGRTDVIRSLTVESRDFVKAMENPELDDRARYAALQKAVNEHNGLTKRSSNGGGWDRHLMGLKVQLRPGETHPLFEDEMYAKSQKWMLSTSGLSAGTRFHATGFGAAWPDGYGINYMLGPYLVKFGMESKVSSTATSTTRMKHNIAQALRDMRRVCEAGAAVDSPSEKAKL